MGHKSYLKNVRGQLRSQYDENAKKAAYVYLGEVRNMVSGKRSGHTYRVPGTGATYTASAPGEPPARRTGDLARSFDLYQQHNASWIVGNTRKYSIMLEKGTSKMEPRPYFVRTARENLARLQRILTRSG